MLFFTAVLALGYWWLVWPRLIAVLFHSRPLGQARRAQLRLQEHIGVLIFASAGLLVLLAWILLCIDSPASGSDRDLQLTALGVGVATTFVYAAFIPPAISAMTHWVRDSSTGAYDDRHLRELRLRPGGVTPVFIAFFNAGISTWSDYRVTIALPDGFVVTETDPAHADSKTWAWAQGSVTPIAPTIVQIIRQAPLASGEPQIFRGFVRAPDTIPDNCWIQFVTVAAGRLGEGRCRLPIVATD
jgi:hypothetical protein